METYVWGGHWFGTKYHRMVRTDGTCITCPAQDHWKLWCFQWKRMVTEGGNDSEPKLPCMVNISAWLTCATISRKNSMRFRRKRMFPDDKTNSELNNVSRPQKHAAWITCQAPDRWKSLCFQGTCMFLESGTGSGSNSAARKQNWHGAWIQLWILDNPCVLNENLSSRGAEFNRNQMTPHGNNK